MRSVAILFILLIVGSNATSLLDKYPLNFTAKRSIMTLLTQIEAKMKAGGPIDAITKMLDDFNTEITEEQVKHDELFALQQKECADEFAFRDSEIQAAESAIAEATETLEGCNSQKVRAEADYDVTTRQLAEDRSFLGLVEETRRREAYAFETATVVYQASTRAIEEALSIIQEIWSGEGSFVQLSKHVNGLIKNFVKLRKVHLLQGVMSALAQLASKDLQADEALLERVNDMLSNLGDKLESEYQAAAQTEEAAIQAYNEDKARLTAAIDSLTTQKAGLEEELRELEKCIVTQTGILFTATQKRDRNQQLLDDAQNLCQSVADEYAAATASRKEELELLNAIRERVEARFAEISSGVQDTINTEDGSYTNEYTGM